MTTDIERLIELAIEQGWRVERDGGHLKLIPPAGGPGAGGGDENVR